jgi:hypothetical protein
MKIPWVALRVFTDGQTNMAYLQTAFWNIFTRKQHQVHSVRFNVSPSTAALSRNEPASSMDMP